MSNDTNGKPDIFIRKFDLNGAVTLVSAAANGTIGNGTSRDAQFSRDGRYVVFESDSTNLVAGDTNGQYDIFRKDLVTGEIIRLSADAAGLEGNGNSYRLRLSEDGRYGVFESLADNLVPGDTNGDREISGSDIFRVDIAALGNRAAVSRAASSTCVSASGRRPASRSPGATAPPARLPRWAAQPHSITPVRQRA